MRIEETLAKFDESKRLKAERTAQAIVAQTSERDAQIARNVGNAREVEKHLKEVVRPVLLESDAKIRSGGHLSKFEVATVSDPDLGREPLNRIRT